MRIENPKMAHEITLAYSSMFEFDKNNYENKKMHITEKDVFLLLVGSILKKNETNCLKVLNDFKTIDLKYMDNKFLNLFNVLDETEIKWLLKTAKKNNVNLVKMTKPDDEGLTALGRIKEHYGPPVEGINLLLDFGFKDPGRNLPVAAWLSLSNMEIAIIDRLKSNKMNLSDLTEISYLGVTAVDVSSKRFGKLLKYAINEDATLPYFAQFGSFLRVLEGNFSRSYGNFSKETMPLIEKMITENKSPFVKAEVHLALSKEVRSDEWFSHNVQNKDILDMVSKLSEMSEDTREFLKTCLEKREILSSTALTTKKSKNRTL